ncbi:hypothetical protein NXC24_PC00418 (plasmid) [Rhizobium sp. NXC24]|nr:hypothetical protein NXC24_PC00418 [Rhizobium sp. NXC24]
MKPCKAPSSQRCPVAPSLTSSVSLPTTCSETLRMIAANLPEHWCRRGVVIDIPGRSKISNHASVFAPQSSADR